MATSGQSLHLRLCTYGLNLWRGGLVRSCPLGRSSLERGTFLIPPADVPRSSCAGARAVQKLIAKLWSKFAGIRLLASASLSDAAKLGGPLHQEYSDSTASAISIRTARAARLTAGRRTARLRRTQDDEFHRLLQAIAPPGWPLGDVCHRGDHGRCLFRLCWANWKWNGWCGRQRRRNGWRAGIEWRPARWRCGERWWGDRRSRQW
jgi:hypothetical protein